MSCEVCEAIIEDTLEEAQPQLMYFRWKNANIAILACPKHAKEVMDVLRQAQEGR